MRQTLAVCDAATKAITAIQTESHPGPATSRPVVTMAHATPRRPWGRMLWWTTASGVTGLGSAAGAGAGAAAGAASGTAAAIVG